MTDFGIQRAPPGSKHKKVAHFLIGGRWKRVPFGARGAMDFIAWSRQAGPAVAAERRRAYILRHAPREDWTDPTTPGALSRWLLWEPPDFREAVAAFAHRLGLRFQDY